MMYEVTIRVMQGRFLLRPDRQSRAIVNAVIARGLALFPAVKLHAFDCQSNHLHQLLSSTDGESIAGYLCYVHGNIARLIGRLRGWAGPFWSRRSRVIPVLDDAAAMGRLRYVIAQGTAAGLVSSPRDWPGACSTPGLLGTMQIDVPRAAWNGDGMSRRTIASTEPDQPSVIRLAPIPAWVGLEADELAKRHAALVADIEAEHAGRCVVGVARLESQDPFEAPTSFEATSAPDCHGSSSMIRDGFRAAFRRFRDAFARAAAHVRECLGRRRTPTGVDATELDRDVLDAAQFPPGSCPRPGWYVRPPTAMLPLWHEAYAITAAA